MDEFIKKRDVLEMIERNVLELFPGNANPKRATALMVMNLIREMPAEDVSATSAQHGHTEPIRLKKIEDAHIVDYISEDGTRFRFNKQDTGRLKGIFERLHELEGKAGVG